MYGEAGHRLVVDAKRLKPLPHLPSYARETVQQASKEIRDLNKEVDRLMSVHSIPGTQDSNGTPSRSTFDPASNPAAACAMLVSHLSMRRNKRCLLAYHRARTDKLEEMCWAGVDVAELIEASTSSTQHEKKASRAVSILSAEEEQYVRSYSDMLASYKGQWTDIDLTGSLEPPRDIFIDVRVLKDAGEIQTEYGSINLTKNSQFYVRQADVERLIAQGYLQKLS